MTTEILDSMAQVLDSMENAVKLRNQARVEKRAEEAKQANIANELCSFSIQSVPSVSKKGGVPLSFLIRQKN